MMLWPGRRKRSGSSSNFTIVGGGGGVEGGVSEGVRGCDGDETWRNYAAGVAVSPRVSAVPEISATGEVVGLLQFQDKIFEKVINPYLKEVLQHPQSIEMREGMLHIRDVEGPKKTESMETWFEAMEQQVFKCQGVVERGLNANHMMITEFTNKHRIDANDIGKHLFMLYDMVDQL
ncbi:40S ribosomal protein S5-1 [Hordeum vulgare]|nr:40S ribosomal protein S5-1 [Hordeum vulgare]